MSRHFVLKITSLMYLKNQVHAKFTFKKEEEKKNCKRKKKQASSKWNILSVPVAQHAMLDVWKLSVGLVSDLSLGYMLKLEN